MMRFAASAPRYVPDHTKSARKAVDDASSLSYMRRGIFHHCNPLIAANAPCMTWWGQTPGTCAHTYPTCAEPRVSLEISGAGTHPSCGRAIARLTRSRICRCDSLIMGASASISSSPLITKVRAVFQTGHLESRVRFCTLAGATAPAVAARARDRSGAVPPHAQTNCARAQRPERC